MLGKALFAVAVTGVLLVLCDAHPELSDGKQEAVNKVSISKRTEVLLGLVGR